MVMGKLESLQKKEAKSFSLLDCTKPNSEWIKDFKIVADPLTPIEEKEENIFSANRLRKDGLNRISNRGRYNSVFMSQLQNSYVGIFSTLFFTTPTPKIALICFTFSSTSIMIIRGQVQLLLSLSRQTSNWGCFSCWCGKIPRHVQLKEKELIFLTISQCQDVVHCRRGIKAVVHLFVPTDRDREQQMNACMVCSVRYLFFLLSGAQLMRQY